MSNRRIVITGIGMVSPLGLNVKDSWAGIIQGKSGVTNVTAFDASGCASQIAAMVKNFDPTVAMDAKDARKHDTFVQYAMVAAAEAMTDCGVEMTDELSERFGVALGSGIGGLSTIEKNHNAYLDKGARRISPFFIPASIINIVAGMVSIEHKLAGPNVSIVTACTTGCHNIGHGARMIKYGDADMMMVGGTEMATTILGLGGFSAMRALSTRNNDPEKASRPWDKDRDGFVLGEGAGVLILEEYEHAKKRGANIYAELAGFGMSADASHITAPSGIGASRAMEYTMQDAGLNKEDIHYINAHGTSTPVGDLAESDAIKATFGDQAKNIPVSSTKSMVGHSLGAAGAMEAIFCILALRDQVAPPTMNLDNPSDDCDLDYVPNTAREMKMDVCMSNSFGFGGTNGSLLFKKFD